MSPLDYDFKRDQARARQDVDSLASAVNLWLAIGLLDMAKPKPSRVKVSRQAASIRAHRAAGVMWLEFVQAEADNAARQESRLAEMERNDWLGAWMQ